MSEAFNHFRLKNEMLIMNYLANAIGVCVVILITYRPLFPQLADALRLIGRIGWLFEPLCGALMLVLTLLYERPIRRFLDDQRNGLQLSGALTFIARKRLLNEPFFLIAMDLVIWIAAGSIYSTAILSSDIGRGTVYYAFFRSLQIGLITTVAAFFFAEKSPAKKDGAKAVSFRWSLRDSRYIADPTQYTSGGPAAGQQSGSFLCYHNDYAGHCICGQVL